MKTLQELKEIVRQKYSKIAEQDKTVNKASCCGTGAASTEAYNIKTDDYSPVERYRTDADAGPGCGLPAQFAQMSRGRGMNACFPGSGCC